MYYTVGIEKLGQAVIREAWPVRVVATIVDKKGSCSIEATYPDGVVYVYTGKYTRSGYNSIGHHGGVQGWCPGHAICDTYYQLEGVLYNREKALQHVQDVLGATREEARAYLRVLPSLTSNQ